MNSTRVVPVEASEETLGRMVQFAMRVSLNGSYSWTDYMRDLYATAISAAPPTDAAQCAVDTTAALDLLARMRMACGDNGLRMQDELEVYLKELARDWARWRKLMAITDDADSSKAFAEFIDATPQADRDSSLITQYVDAAISQAQPKAVPGE